MSDAQSAVNGLQPPLAAFLEAFRAASQSQDLDVLRACFADTFLAGDSNGATPVDREAFLRALPARAAAAEKAGVGLPELIDASAMALDSHWSLLRTRWSAPLPGGGQMAMSSTFLLYDDGKAARASVYLNHYGLPHRASDFRDQLRDLPDNASPSAR